MPSSVIRAPLFLAAAWLSGTLAACGASQPPAARPGAAPPASNTAPLLARAKAAFGVLPSAPADPPEQVALGRRLFFETRVSADGQVGCVTCHLPEKWGTDGRTRARGVFGRENPRNSPTVFNAAYQSAQHWHADRDSVEDQARRALLGKGSFGLPSEEEATQRLQALPAPYPDAFRRAFAHEQDPVSIKTWGAALGAYERTLLTPGPFDSFLNGDANALSAAARAGLGVFLDEGCASCHDGALLGGRSLRKFGLHADYAPLTHSDPVDNGRFDATKDENDRYLFKVAGLRNVAQTAPYFHDGSVATLPEAIDIMARAQLGKRLSAEQVGAVASFLEALTGPVPATFSPPP
jgi:cytochrome c peroxidase